MDDDWNKGKDLGAHFSTEEDGKPGRIGVDKCHASQDIGKGCLMAEAEGRASLLT